MRVAKNPDVGGFLVVIFSGNLNSKYNDKVAYFYFILKSVQIV